MRMYLSKSMITYWTMLIWPALWCTVCSSEQYCFLLARSGYDLLFALYVSHNRVIAQVHFGYIYGFSIFGCSSLWAVINLLDSHEKGLDIWRTSSVLGYCLLPIIGLAGTSAPILFHTYTPPHVPSTLRPPVPSPHVCCLCRRSSVHSCEPQRPLGTVSVGGGHRLVHTRLDTVRVTDPLPHALSDGLSMLTLFICPFRIFDSAHHFTGQYWLVAYPIMLFYCCFVLITVF